MNDIKTKDDTTSRHLFTFLEKLSLSLSLYTNSRLIKEEENTSSRKLTSMVPLI